jgi:hypothetical protein
MSWESEISRRMTCAEADEAFVQLWRKISDGLGDDLADRLDDEPLRWCNNDHALAR